VPLVVEFAVLLETGRASLVVEIVIGVKLVVVGEAFADSIPLNIEGPNRVVLVASIAVIYVNAELLIYAPFEADKNRRLPASKCQICERHRREDWEAQPPTVTATHLRNLLTPHSCA